MLAWSRTGFTRLLLTRCWACVVYLLHLRRPTPSQQKGARLWKGHNSMVAISTTLTEHEEALGYTTGTKTATGDG